MPDSIHISRLKVPVYIGVPEEERASSQDIEISLTLIPEKSLFGTQDEIDKTIDYYKVYQDVLALTQERPRKLIEQLNEDILNMLLKSYPLESASITTYKFIIPEADHVAVEMTLRKEGLV